jgi:hypothetical protein
MQSARLTAACSRSSEGRSCQLRSPSMKQPRASACPRLDPSPRDPGSAQHPVTSGNSTHRNRCVLLWGCPPVRHRRLLRHPGRAERTSPQPGNQPPGRPGTPITGFHRHQDPAGVLAPAGQHHREGPRSRHRDSCLATRPGPALPARATRWLASPLRLPCLRRRTSGYARRRLRGERSQRSAGSEGVHRGPAGPESSRAWQYARGKGLIEPHGGVIVAEIFDIDKSRSIPPQRRPRSESAAGRAG